MKTVGRITATLAVLLGLYLLGYWFLIKRDWSRTLFFDPVDAFSLNRVDETIHSLYKPLRELESFLILDRIFRKMFVGHWRSDKDNGFVAINANKQCRFQMGQFAFEGLAVFNPVNSTLILEFPFQDQECLFIFQLTDGHKGVGHSDQASAAVLTISDVPFKLSNVKETTLTKQAPGAPAP